MNRLVKLCLLAAVVSVCTINFGVSPAKAKRHATIIQGSLAVVGKHPEPVFQTLPITGSLAVTPDERYALFASREGGMSWSSSGFSGKIIWDADIYVSERKDSGWGTPVNLGKKINDPHDQGAPAVTVDGQIVYFLDYREGWQNDGGPIYRGTLHGRTWTNAVGLGGAITDFFIHTPFCGGITISPDGKTLIASAAVSSTGQAHFHLFIFHKTLAQDWTAAASLSVNSDSSEINPHFAPDGKTLYFASSGYEGFGSFDVYKTVVLDADSCGEVFNMGSSINTSAPETDISFNILGTYAYLKRGTGFYRIEVDPLIKEISASPSIMFTGIVTDSKSGDPLEATMVLSRDKVTDYEASSNSTTGSYAMIVHPQVHYKLRIVSPGFAPLEESIFLEDAKAALVTRDFSLKIPEMVVQRVTGNAVGRALSHGKPVDSVQISVRDTASLVEQRFTLSDTTGRFDVELPPGKACVVTLTKKNFFPRSIMVSHDSTETANLGDIDLKLMNEMAASGEGIRLSSIQFDKSAAVIRPQSFGDLDRIAEALKDANVSKIVISGYSDSKGRAEFNLELSKRRAESVAKYLAEKGVPKSKLETDGFGAENPIASNETEEGRQLNRRVEFKFE